VAERFRLFQGVNELNYSKAQVIKSTDYIVDHALFDIESDSNVDVGSTIDFKKKDGSTTVFTAKVLEIKKPGVWVIEALTNGFELMNIRIEQVYTNETPEDIVADVISRTTNLTYASTSTSGRTITKYVAKAYAIDVIKDMIDVLDWQLTIDENDNVFFDPKEFVDNSVTLTNGTDIQITEWISDKRSMFNQVKVIGGFENKLTTGELQSGTGTVFTLDNKPVGSIRAVVSGSEVDPTTYTVDGEERTVTFDATKTDPSFDYTYNIPVVVVGQNDSSINTYDTIFKEVPAPWLNRIPDARLYAQELLDIFSTPLVSAKGFEAGLNFNREIGEVITVVDDLRSITERLVVVKIVLDAVAQKTILTFGSREYLLYDWEREVESRIKKIERRETNETDEVFSRLIQANMKVTLSVSETFEQNSPVDSFILGHPTLGRLRTDLNYEADCSDNGLFGDWQGSGIGGSQYTTSGYRLSAGSFNGSDNYVDVTGSAAGIKSVSFYLKPSVLNRDLIQLSATAKISMDGSGDITTSGLSNVTWYVDKVLSASISTGSWQLVTVLFDAHTADDIQIGFETTYYSGDMDEVMFFSGTIDTDDMQTIIDKDFYDSSNNFTISNLEGYWAMDNCRLGDRSSARVTVI
jgi:hypothetical protein